MPEFASVLIFTPIARLGNSGLKVSKIILGCMSYGDPDWMSWVLPEDKAIEHIKFAYVELYKNKYVYDAVLLRICTCTR